jgi:uncharacterized protein YbbC (DUF1343 family)
MRDNSELPPSFRRFLAIVLVAGVLTVTIFFDVRSAAHVPPRSQAKTRVLTGIDALEELKFAPLRGKRIGLITNQTGVDGSGRRSIDVLAHARGVTLVAIFSPEHGVLGLEDDRVASTTDAATGAPVFSLYGETRRPTPAVLKGIDALVFDIQDAGVRFYTFITTMAYSMEEAAKAHISFLVLDRPDPIDGVTLEGPVLDRDRLSFAGYFPLPVRYAMTLGELAQMFNAENKIGADLHVVTMKRWRRSERYADTGLEWIPPSPNLRTLNATLLYPGLEILQAGGISVGRGTSTPFETFGAPWIDADRFAAELNRRNIPGVRFATAHFTPTSAIYVGSVCGGVAISITDPDAVRSMTMGLEIASLLHKMYPEEFHLDKIIALLGSGSAIAGLQKGDSPEDIVAGWAPDLAAFRQMRQSYLLYP